MTTPLFMRDVSLTLKLVAAGTRLQFNCDVKTAEIVSTPGDTVEVATLCVNGQFKQIGKTAFDLHIVAVQDWSATGLAMFLWTNDGATAEFQYQAHATTAIPPTAAQPGMSGVVTLVAPNYGGEVNNYAELDVTLPCQTKPVIATAAFPALAADGRLAEDDETLGLEGEAETAAA
jgi:hypothetical protein